MGRRFSRLSGIGAGLTLNGLRPLPGDTPLSIPSFFAGWVTSELAPQNLAITAARATTYWARHRKHLTREDKLALGANLASIAGLSLMIAQGMRSKDIVESALTQGLDDDYVAKLDPAPDKPDLATPWRQVLMPWQVKHPAVKRVKDIPYVDDGSPRHLLDVYHPREPGTKRPVLLQIHGGGWVIGRKDEQGLPMMTHFASHDWVCVAPNYPLSPKATWPEHLIALKQALVWVKDTIEDYGGDPSFICVTGGSAGGHLAALLALTADDPRYQPGFEDADTTVQACVPFYGAYDMANVLGTRAGQRRVDMFFARTIFKTRDRRVMEDASPLLQTHRDAPPFFVVHGAHDSLVNVAEARELVRRLREVSHQPVVYAELPGAQHAFDVFASIRSAHVIRGVERFLRWVQATRIAEAADRRS
jgi:acetyl esterase/lipase